MSKRPNNARQSLELWLTTTLRAADNGLCWRDLYDSLPPQADPLSMDLLLSSMITDGHVHAVAGRYFADQHAALGHLEQYCIDHPGARHDN